MSRPDKDKMPTSAQPGGGMFQAFAGLEIAGLPDAPAGSPGPAPETAARPPAKLGRVVLRRETAHRGGKCVIVVDDFDPGLDSAFIEALAKRLRAACGCGGAVKKRAIELHGEQAGRARELLAAEGFRVVGVS